VQAAFAATLVDEWVRCGVVHAVVCPGSRSAPLAVALADHPAMAVHVRLDERSAAFTALGIGRATGSPALVVTTSGTAAAELHPAVVEAHHGQVPLIACTADRPPELRDVGAPQAIDQTHLFGPSVRWFVDPGVPDRAARSSWRSLAARVVEAARSGGEGPGPVHLNLSFREPLLGDVSAGGGVPPPRPGGGPWHRVRTATSSGGAEVARALVTNGMIGAGQRGLIVAGAGCGGDPEPVLSLASALGWPVLAEPRSGLRVPGATIVALADGILRAPAFAALHRPEAILHLGGRWVSKVVNGFLSEAVRGGARSVMVQPGAGWDDPEHEVDEFVRADPSSFCRQVVAALAEGSSPGAETRGDNRSGQWMGQWTEAERRARTLVGGWLGTSTSTLPSQLSSADPHDGVTEPELAHRLFAALPGGSTLVVSSSMPVRDLESFGLPRSDPPRVVANRGANGIDGVVSTALGVALGSPGPTVVLLGDLAFLHDVSALLCASGAGPDLTVVVADNGGGGIFSFLPPATALEVPVFERLFGTPPATDVARVAEGFGWVVDDLAGASADQLELVLHQRIGRGPSVIRVGLPDRAENVAIHRRINEAVARVVDEGLG